jgi:chorismate dehydratase
MAKRLGIVPYRYAQPLFVGLRARSMFELVEDVPAQLAIRLREKQLDGAFLSPIDFAKDYAMYRLLPTVAAVSEGDSGTVLLFFHEHARKFKTVGFDPTTPTSDVVLANLILKEKYGVTPQFVPFVGSVEASLQTTDAVLVSGDGASARTGATNRLDLVDEWNDLAELPYVHGVWVTREGSLDDEEVKAIVQSSAPESRRESDANTVHFSYELNETAVTALTEFFRMAYYHGILPDVPEVRFISLDRLPPASKIS